MTVASPDIELDDATRHFWHVAERLGLPTDWRELDRQVRRLTGRDPERLSPREWVALAAALEEAPT